MNLLKMIGKLAVFAVVVVVALTIFGKVRQRAGAAGGGAAAEKQSSGGPSAADDRLSDAGFFLLNRAEANNPHVVIMSPPNCPSEEAARAQALGRSLNSAGIPTEFRQEMGGNLETPEDAARVNKYLNNVANPLVLVRGWAKGNPTAQDVIAQYHSGR